MSDAASALKHFDKIVAIARRAEEKAFAVFSHDYDYLCFGSFQLEVGTRKRRKRYSWDGKEGFLDIQTADFSDSRTPGRWTPVRNLRLEFSDAEPYRTIETDITG